MAKIASVFIFFAFYLQFAIRIIIFANFFLYNQQ